MSSPRDMPVSESAPETLPTETNTPSLKQATHGTCSTAWDLGHFCGALLGQTILNICWNRPPRSGMSNKARENSEFITILLAGGILFPIALVLVFKAEKLIPERWQGRENMWRWGLLEYVALICLTAAFATIMHADVKFTVTKIAVGTAIVLFFMLYPMELDNCRKGSAETRQPMRSA
ncbi:hypothetical protein DL96DRAFT_1716069 [Flagelloscypha sp. PMI_526]|nr:hypothetical protein DL96DRAFT_1716069 [Flagelloscypha sp. PMI_526]